jgi:hypothetical protein
MTTSLLEQTDDTQIDPSTNYLEELVGDGKKFKSVEDLAKGKYLADIHATNLERRLDEMREDYKKVSEEAKAAKRMEELLDRLDSTNTNLTSRDTTPSNEDNKTAFNPEQLDSILTSKLSQMKEQERSEQNFRTVMEKVKEQYGTNYANALKDQAKDLDMSEDEINSLARRNPKAFFRTFGIGEERSTETFQAPPQSSRQSTFAPRIPKRTYSYYQNLRRENPNLYYDSKIAVQMDKDAQALGEDFFDV